MGTNTGLGIGIGIPFKNFSSGGRQPLPPDLKASLKGVWIAYGKSNNDADRSIVKNLVDPDNPFVISNAAYTEGSGYADKDSPYYGAFVTDGIDDLITSTKTVQEMDITDEVTVVSMIHQIDLNSTYTIATTNYIENSNSREHVRSDVYNYGKTGIYGYSASLINNTKSDIKNILGDEADYYVKSTNSLQTIFDAKFSVVGRISELTEASQVTWYWTIIANKVLTTDQINQVIAYFNLDKTVKPDILCNITKQGITNDNHADFNDKLIDYSGNGRDIQMNNLAWKGGSGIAAKPFETIKDYTILSDEARQELTIYNEFSYKVKSNTPNHYWVVQSIIKDNTSYQVTIITDKDCYWINSTSFTNNKGNKENIRKEYPVKANTPTQVIICGLNEFEYPEGIEPTTAVSYVNLEYAGEITVTFIPSHKGGLLLDGVNDFGKVTGMPIYKDYTVIADYIRISAKENAQNSPILSKSKVIDSGAFLFNYLNADSVTSSSSFGTHNALKEINDFERKIYYLSKYASDGYNVNAGSAVDYDTMWLGAYRDNAQNFFNGAIYSLMSFPYSMSEFLIERQLKKHKLGTLYPNMVEFRPVIKSNASYDNIVFYYKNEKVENGTYLTVGSSIDMHIRLSSSPVNEIKSITVNGIPATFKYHDANNNIYQYDFNLTSKSPQNINITIDEYIRYEDIVQPYPSLFTLIDYDTEEVYSWGSKLKVGARFKGNVVNLLPNIYEWQGNVLYNGEVLDWGINPGVVAKEMVFSWNMPFKYLIDNNEPKVILSPRLLRIPNSSYKILGYIPDISGHGNHGKINNSAYAEASGVNGYLLDFKTFTTGNSSLVNIKDDSRIEVININKEKSTTWVNLNKSTSISLSSWKIKVTGMKSGDTLGYYYSESTDATLRSKFDIKSDGIYSLPSSIANSNNIGDIAFDVVAGADSAYRIEQIGEYEGAYCLDGVDDFITIPTLSSGGKQVLMKVNWQKQDTMLYNQNPGQDNFAIFTNDYNNNNLVVAYASRNNGNTYIDGVVNNNILATQLKGITHNIVATNNNIDATITPIIGSNKDHDNFFAQMSLYDFMLFDEISTDDKIKELNTYIGITPKVTLPNYYWDNYGKKNIDANRGYIDEQVSLQKTGTSVNPLENFNISYEGMSGYNGYPVVFGVNKTWETSNAVDYIYDINSTIVHITNVKHAANGLLYSYVKRDGALANIKEIPAFRVTVKGLEENSKLVYKYLATENATKESIVYLGNGTHKLPKSFVPTDALLDLTTNSWIGFAITPMIEGELVFDCDITIEVLPEYENGLAYDGVSDFTDNKNIPILTDFTFIIKREILGLETNESMLVIKGDKVYNNGIGNAFILEHNSNGVNYVYSYGKLNQIKRNDSKIIYLTPESYNGNPIIKGENGDNLGLILSRYWKGIIYKTILYSKTISLLEINFLKNLMEKDEIIDINHPIFISNTEDESNTSQDT